MIPRWVRWLVDVAVVSGCVICIVHVSRRHTVDCTWQRMRATCTIENEDALGRIERTMVSDVRGVAYRSGHVVGLVTDAQNHDEHALFGTREIELDDDVAAERLRAFAHDHDPDHVAIISGVSRPALVTGLILAALLVYGILTARRRSSR